jgi:hypothetical protein
MSTKRVFVSIHQLVLEVGIVNTLEEGAVFVTQLPSTPPVREKGKEKKNRVM